MRLPGYMLLALTTLWVAPARAEPAVAAASADSVAQFLAIARYCPAQIATDRARAERYADEFAAIGRRQASPSGWARLLETKAVRYLRIIQATGDRAWCLDQRRFLEEAGVANVLPR